MKLLLTLAMVLVICLMAIALPALPTGAQDGEGAAISLSPNSGVPETVVTVYGYNFTADKWVDIHYDGMWMTQASVTAQGAFTATFVVPDSYRGQHTVLARDETGVSASTSFTVRSELTVSPEEGRVGDTVTATGRGYGRNEMGIELYFGGQRVAEDRNIVANADGWWQEEFQVPPSIRGSHTITTAPSVPHRTPVFTVIPGISILDEPSGSVVDEPSGSPGDSITVTGGGFTAGERNISILFAGEEVRDGIRSDDRGYWEESFEVPERPRGTYPVTAGGDRTAKEDVGELSFEMKPGLVLSPGEGHVGMNVTVTGGGFSPYEDVTIFYEDQVSANTTTNEKGSFEVTFAVPESRHGGRNVTAGNAEDAEGNEATGVFTMELDPPPIPELISPSDGNRVGFAVRMRPTFEWSEVEDPSGVYYSLQVSTSANFTEESVAVSVTGVNETRYKLARAEALPYGTYYWRVQAVDGAENESGWTEAESFHAGRLPLWAFIVIIVFIALLGGGLVYFHVIRKGLYD